MHRPSGRLIAVLFALSGLGIVQPAPAAGGCRATSQPLPATPASPATARTCTYIASGGGDFDAVMTGDWEIWRKRGNLADQMIQSGSTPKIGSFEAQPGDRITIRIQTGEGFVSAEDS